MDKAATKVTGAADRTLLTTTAQALRAQIKPKTEEAGVGRSDRYLSPRAIAKEVGIEAEFDLHNVLVSKLVHATGYSVLVPQDEDSKRLVMNWTFKYAAYNALSILDALNARLKDLGLPTFA